MGVHTRLVGWRPEMYWGSPKIVRKKVVIRTEIFDMLIAVYLIVLQTMMVQLFTVLQNAVNADCITCDMDCRGVFGKPQIRYTFFSNRELAWGQHFHDIVWLYSKTDKATREKTRSNNQKMWCCFGKLGQTIGASQCAMSNIGGDVVVQADCEGCGKKCS